MWVFIYFNHFIFIQICDEGNDLAVVVDEIEFLNCCIFGHFIGYVRGNGDEWVRNVCFVVHWNLKFCLCEKMIGISEKHAKDS